jgi:hypothetical protein
MPVEQTPTARWVRWPRPKVALVLGLDDAATWRLIRDGLVPARSLGRRIVVPRDELEALLRQLPAYPAAGNDADDNVNAALNS